MSSSDELRDRLIEEMDQRPGAAFVLARLCNLIKAIADETVIRKIRSSDCPSSDLVQMELKTNESIISLIDGLVDPDKKEGLYDGIRSGRA